DYKHYCACHSADSSFQLANVKYFLKDEASVWWRNQQDSVKSFEEFCDVFLKIYGNPEKTRSKALKLLSNRPQRTGESCFAYVQAIQRLCYQVDPAMLEVEKVRYILRGIAKNVFWILALKRVSTVSQLLTEVQELDTLLANRLESSHVDQLDNVIEVPSFLADSSEGSSESSESDEPELTQVLKKRRRRPRKSSSSSAPNLRETITEVVKEILALQTSSNVPAPGRSSPAVAAVRPQFGYNRRPSIRAS